MATRNQANLRNAIVFLIIVLIVVVASYTLVNAAFVDTQNQKYLPLIAKNYEATITPTPKPQILISGKVSLPDGTGLANVEIRSRITFSPVCEGLTAALTDPKGEFVATISCPEGHDETIMICPYLEGYTFEPERIFIRTYGRCPVNHSEFLAIPPTPTQVTPVINQ